MSTIELRVLINQSDLTQLASLLKLGDVIPVASLGTGIGDYIDDRVDVVKEWAKTVEAGVYEYRRLYASYSRYLAEAGLRGYARPQLSAKLAKLGYVRRRGAGGVVLIVMPGVMPGPGSDTDAGGGITSTHEQGD